MKRLVLVGVSVAAAIVSHAASAATITVTNLDDDGPGSFRQALRDAMRDDVINFAVTGTIVVRSLPLQPRFTGPIFIQGPGADRLAVSGNGLVRVFSFFEAIVTMSGLTIRDGNSRAAPVFNTRGGGIHSEGALTLNDCVIINNQGGGIDCSGRLEMNRCTVANNTTLSARTEEPIGVSVAAGITATIGTITNSTIVDNEAINQELTDPAGAVRAGGVSSSFGLKIVGCTIAGNRISGSGGFPGAGGVASGSNTSPITVTDTIIAGNTYAPAPDSMGSFTSSGYNLIGNKLGSTGFSDGANRDRVGGGDKPVIDARLGALGNNGGTTPTVALLSDSPAIDQGLSSLPTDQRGANRRFDLAGIPNAEGGDGSDVGAYELSAAAPARLLNISTRAQVQSGDNVMIGGFIITGSDPKNVLLRAIGPSLDNAGVQGALRNPTLELFQGNTLLASNDDWKQNQRTEIEATGIPPTNDAESAIVRKLAAGSYTAVVRGANNDSGVALVEAYDLEQGASAQLANISTRAFVQTDDKVLIGGLIVGPANTTSRVLVRAIGPSLGGSGVAGALPDPTLELFDGNGVSIAANDNWKETQQTDIAATGVPPSDDRESAILQPLPAGNYTAVVRGKNGTTGVALVEAFNLQ